MEDKIRASESSSLTPGIRYFDRSGNPMEMEDWARSFEDTRGRRIGRNRLPTGVRVSTVWLGLDHRFGEGPPLIFETMIFGLKRPHEPMWRYTTEAEARKGHWKALCFARKEIGNR